MLCIASALSSSEKINIMISTKDIKGLRIFLHGLVENSWLFDTMNHLLEKAKEDVRKILSSKHLFYEEIVFRSQRELVEFTS